MSESVQSPLDALTPPVEQGQCFSHSSELPIPAEDVLATLNFAGVNFELGPWVQMSAPASWASQGITAWPTKLTLSPALGDSLMDVLADVQAGSATDCSGLRQYLPEPPLGKARWD